MGTIGCGRNRGQGGDRVRTKFVRILMTALLLSVPIGTIFTASPAGGVFAKTPFPITNQEDEQTRSDVDGNIIVWQDGRAGTCGAWDVWMYDMSTGVEKPVTTADKKQTNPRVSNGIVVYQSDEDCNSDGNSNIYGYDVEADEIFPICTEPGWQGYPDIDGDIVVWVDYRDGDEIYMYDLASQEETLLTECPGNNYDVRISGDIVVWENYRWYDGVSDIYMFDISTGEMSVVCDADGYQWSPNVSGDTIVWVDERECCEPVIYAYDLTTETEAEVPGSLYGEFPAIDGDTIVWASHGGERLSADAEDASVRMADAYPARAIDGSGLKMHDLSSGITSQLTMNTDCDGRPSISGSLVSFNRYIPEDGNPDIWAIAFEDIPTVYNEVQGLTRYQTAVKLSQESFPNGSDWIIVATGQNWPDALGASALAGMYDAPILLTRPNSIPGAVKDEIERLGATDAFVIGGPQAISDAVVTALEGMLEGDVIRLGGATRYETAQIVASETVAANPEWNGTAFVTTGRNFPDALAAAPLASRAGWPIFLAGSDGISEDTQDVMDELGVTNLLLLGGTGVLPASLEAQVTGLEVDRIWGMNRYATAVAVATWGEKNLGLSWDGMALATGEDYPDALAAGAAQGLRNSVMLLTPATYLDSATAGALAAHKYEIISFRYVGGPDAVSPAVRAQVAQILP